MAFRFLHIADVHLGFGFAAADPDLRRELREASRSAFRAAVDLCLRERLHALLVAGDLFDRESVPLGLERFFAGELARLRAAGVACVYVTGNHDPGGPGSRILAVAWPESLVVVGGHRPVTVDVTDRDGRLVGRVTGVGHEGPRDGTNLVASLPPAPGDGVPHAALVHAYVSGVAGAARGQDRYAPASLADFRGLGYGYFALGHIHRRQPVSTDPPVWYAGSLLGLDPTETGPKGGLVVELDPGGARVEEVTLAPIRRETVEVATLGEAGDWPSLQAEVVRRAEEALAERGALGSELLVRVVLEGPSPLAHEVLRELAGEEGAAEMGRELAQALGVRAVEVRAGRLVPAVALDRLLARGPSPLREAVELIRRARVDDELLLRLDPGPLAGFDAPAGEDGRARLDYLRELLEGLEAEAAFRFTAGRAAVPDRRRAGEGG